MGLLLNLAFFFLLHGCGKAEQPSNTDNSTSDQNEMDRGPLDKLRLPDGFQIAFYAKNVQGARSMVMSPDGTLFVGTRGLGKVYALRDNNGDNKVDEQFVIAEDLVMPNGVAYRDKALYVAEVSRLWRYDNIEANLSNPGPPVLIYEDYPTETHHGWKYIAFGPDDKLYVPVGAPCNICESEDEIFASITRMNPDGSNREIYAHGVRNTVGFTWHPETGQLWFTDNGRDHLGDNSPPCELNVATTGGQHFGYPYCHGGDIADPEYGDLRPCSEFISPAQNLGPHVAPLGLKFYTGNMFPQQYENVILIAEHGSWNRSSKIGYKIAMVREENGRGVSYEPFIEGWLEGEEAWGRPVDILILKDGSMLISDDKFGAIYRVTYSD